MRERTSEAAAIAIPVLIAELFTALFIVGVVLIAMRNGS